eukprot:gene15685-17600_t
MWLEASVIFFIIAALSILANIFVLYFIYIHYSQSFQAITTKLITMLHISCLLQNIFSLPSIYSADDTICAIMGFAHYYTGLINVADIIFLTIVYYSFITGKGQRTVRWIGRYGAAFAWTFSLITLLPYSTNSYGRADVWCTLTITNNLSNAWSFAVFYIWILLAIVICSYVCTYIIYFSAKFDRELSRRLFTSFGVYVLISILCFLPRVIPRFVALFYHYNVTDAIQFITGIPMYIAGICYCISFAYNNNLLKMYERSTASTNNGEPRQSLSLNSIFDEQNFFQPSRGSVTSLHRESIRLSERNSTSIAAEMKIMESISPMVEEYHRKDTEKMQEDNVNVNDNV